MSAAGQLDFPIQVGVTNLCRDGLGVADPGPIRPTKPRPFLGMKRQDYEWKKEGVSEERGVESLKR